MQSVVGTILDPAADKMLMTTLTITLAMKDLIPGTLILHFVENCDVSDRQAVHLTRVRLGLPCTCTCTRGRRVQS